MGRARELRRVERWSDAADEKHGAGARAEKDPGEQHRAGCDQDTNQCRRQSDVPIGDVGGLFRLV